MANTFTRKLSRGIGTSAVNVGGYTVGANTTSIVVGMSVSNTSASAITVSVYINDAATNDTYIVTNAPVSAGSSLVIVGGDQKIVLIEGDKMYVQTSAASSADAVMSIMEIT